jgi:hypothetical protein
MRKSLQTPLLVRYREAFPHRKEGRQLADDDPIRGRDGLCSEINPKHSMQEDEMFATRKMASAVVAAAMGITVLSTGYLALRPAGALAATRSAVASTPAPGDTNWG